MRRCGKSSLLKLLGQRLVSTGVPSDHILTINLESFEFASFDRTQLHDRIMGLMHDHDRYYLLLDEVQLIDGWERVVNALRVDENVDIYLTGSNAHLLSRQLGTLLSGRYVEIRVFLLSFSRSFFDTPGNPIVTSRSNGTCDTAACRRSSIRGPTRNWHTPCSPASTTRYSYETSPSICRYAIPWCSMTSPDILPTPPAPPCPSPRSSTS
ncbi:hypothetical protein CPA40_05965 [Bifidobacterium callitrichos]|uniref:AAA domain-containing protein n=1 Tax=Bifidobacterium callitrichos TaxID=762209 RepID=A0A2T3GAA6_9BIFI|nr:hypothetical protein CPA40_05965 [Bifidobacterium callitrichos]